MKYLDEFRNPILAKKIIANIEKITSKPWNIMEICGGQTHSIIKYGIDQLIPSSIQLIHGPGCPVCVTPLEKINRALKIASQSNVIFTSFGDMLRVPGSEKDLFTIKSEGGDIRMVYSPLESLAIAKDNPEKEVVFFAVGFETTAPGNAMAVIQAQKESIKNFSMIVTHVLVPPAMEAILSRPTNKINGFLAAGHVCSIMGWLEYEAIAEKYQIPIVPTGFEPVDILDGIYRLILQLEQGKFEVENQYLRSVKREGNPHAQKIMSTVFEICNQKWRGIGTIPLSGLKLRDEFRDYDAETRFHISDIQTNEPEECISGEILQGLRKPYQCPAFKTKCTPLTPLGATMVSSEGACAAYYQYQRVS